MADDTHENRIPAGMGDDGIPHGWDYNPATWAQRLPIIILALIGGAIAFYLTLYQWRAFESVWDPFFSGGPDHENGSAKILRSKVSYVLPMPFTDGFLGFLGYVGDAVTGAIGGTRRWRTMPWIVILFGILVGPLGAISIGLVMTQPLGYDTFCTLCLATAVISVLMIGPAMDEMLASLQYMKRVREHDLPFWRYFFGLADQQPLPEGAIKLTPTVESSRPGWIAITALWIIAAIGIYLMTASDIWGYGGGTQTVERVIGPLVAAFAIVAAWESTRNVRWVNLPLALALAVLPPLLGASMVAIISNLLCAAGIALLTFVPYPPTQQFGGGWPRLAKDRRLDRPQPAV